jgi:GntR family transcriptional repressor for pyruvate dehydrogenase complex
LSSSFAFFGADSSAGGESARIISVELQCGKLVRPLSPSHQRGGSVDLPKTVVAALESLVLQAHGDEAVRLPSERALADHLGVSRASVREALQHFRTRGLIVSKRGSGLYTVARRRQGDPSCWMAQPTEAERAEMFEIRLMIEAEAAQRAAMRAMPVDLQALDEALANLQQAINQRDLEQEAEADTRFHLVLVAAAHNTLLKRLYLSLDQALQTHIQRNTYEASFDRDDAGKLARSRLAQHERISRAIHMGDGVAAHSAMTAHICFVKNQFTY